MTLPLFSTGSAAARPVTLVRLASELARSVAALGLLAVEGEVHRPTTSRGGWMFFTLRDRAAQVDVKVPKGNLRRCRVVTGERACVVGQLEWSPDRGEVHLVAEEVTPVGAGAIAALVADTRRRLGSDGLLVRPRRGLPLLPAVIGVICGAEAAVRKDIESVVATRFPGYPVIFEETTVSGPGAATSIVDALERIVTRPGVEVVILARGGGDATALLPWSAEEVCRGAAACPVPVVAAIGHEGDRPLVDEVADLRCGTPSIAAAVVVPDRVALLGLVDDRLAQASRSVSARLEGSARRMAAVDTGRSLRSGLERARARADRARERLDTVHPARWMEANRRQLQAVGWRRPMGERLGRASGRLEAEERHLRALSPRRVLQRGYAVVTRPDGSVLRRAAEVSAGSLIDVALADGRLSARVEETHGA